MWGLTKGSGRSRQFLRSETGSGRPEVNDRPDPGFNSTEDNQMPLYRWEDYQCSNFGNCKRADRREIIDLPRGAKAVCPTCGKPVVPLRAREIVLVSPPSGMRVRPVKRRIRWLVASFVLLILGLAGGTAFLLLRSPETQPAPMGRLERLYVSVPAQVTARVGDALQIPITVGPVLPADLVLTVDGPLPPGVFLDVAGRQLHGTAQSAGVSPIIITARAPRYTSASAEMSLVIKPEPLATAVLTLQVPPEVEGRVGVALEVPITIRPLTAPDPVLTVVGKLPAGVSLDSVGKRLVGIPRSPGSYGVIVKASTPNYAPALAEVTFTILDAKPSPSPAPKDHAVATTGAQDRSGPNAAESPASIRLRQGDLTTRNGK